ncbi:MAG: hypothetical protein JXQ29_02150 [Planctomycetes bacterium]|nr:hypothetical protein [Planctomycetota bacterium]
MPDDATSDWAEVLATFEPPVLILSTAVGRGMYSLGEAVRERFAAPDQVHHIAVEERLPAGAVAEDLKRYRFLSTRLTPLLYLVYTCPLFYYRKLARERWFHAADLSALEATIGALGIRTVLCISHRAAFWASSLKWRRSLDVALWDLLGEYGNNLGYRFLFWEAIDGFLSPLARSALRLRLPDHVRFMKVALPARRAFVELAATAGDRRTVLLVSGYWGQGPLAAVLRGLRQTVAHLTVHVVCGDDRRQRERVRRVAGDGADVRIHGAVDSLAPLMAQCGSVITKPGISTLVEAHAARRKIFLLRGMPVAEANNARFAVQHFDATWYTPARWREWCER